MFQLIYAPANNFKKEMGKMSNIQYIILTRW